MTEMRKYQEQLERAKRFKARISKRLDDYSKGNVSEKPMILFDMIHNFFCECHNIKDYIVNDDSLSITSKTIDTFISKNDCLKICADICNGRKHLKLRKGGWTGGTPRFNMNIEFKEDRSDIYVEFQSKIGDREFFNLADECIEKWTEFINKEVK